MVNLENKGTTKQVLRNIQWKIEHLAKNADLTKPETVEHFIAKLPNKNTYKASLCQTYKQYCKYKKIQWETPSYPKDAKEIKCPSHEKIEMIIADSGKTLALKLKLSLETGLRPVEIFHLNTNDIDTTKRIVYPTTAKHGAPRKLKISQNLTDLIQDYINRNKRQQNETLFKGNPITYGKDFREVRNRLAKKLNDPTLKNIRLYDLRHYFGTMEYHKTKDIKDTQYKMGHKHSSTTDIYVHILETEEDNQYTCKTASNIQEATPLIEAGFTEESEFNGIKIYKKRK